MDFNFFIQFSEMFSMAYEAIFNFLSSDVIVVLSGAIGGVLTAISYVVNAITFGKVDLTSLVSESFQFFQDVNGTYIGSIIGFIAFFLINLGFFFIYRFIRFLLPFV